MSDEFKELEAAENDLVAACQSRDEAWNVYRKCVGSWLKAFNSWKEKANGCELKELKLVRDKSRGVVREVAGRFIDTRHKTEVLVQIATDVFSEAYDAYQKAKEKSNEQ